MELCSRLYHDFRYDYLARLCIKIVNHVPKSIPWPRSMIGRSSTSLANRWTAQLQSMRDSYLKSEIKQGEIDGAERHANTDHRVKGFTEGRFTRLGEESEESSAKGFPVSPLRLRIPTRISVSSDTDSASSTGYSNYFGVGKRDLWETDAGDIV